MPNTSGQRRGQAWMASENIKREGQRIARERGISEDDGVAAVFADPELLKKCHGVPAAKDIAPDWVPET